MTKEHLIPFSESMVLANMAGRKTATRRMSAKYGKVRKGDIILQGEAIVEYQGFVLYEADTVPPAHYDSDGKWDGLYVWRWKVRKLPAIFMPRYLVRARYVVTKDAYQQPVWEITEEDAWKEGVHQFINPKHPYINKWGVGPALSAFSNLWNSLYSAPLPVRKRGKIIYYISYPWKDVRETKEHKGKPWHVVGNPWVWRIGYKKARKGCGDSLDASCRKEDRIGKERGLNLQTKNQIK